jgi:hypothetical protein
MKLLGGIGRVGVKRERGQADDIECVWKKGRREEKKRSNKHEKVNGMVKWNYLGHRRTVDPNKVKGMTRISAFAVRRMEIFRLMDRVHVRMRALFTLALPAARTILALFRFHLFLSLSLLARVWFIFGALDSQNSLFSSLLPSNLSIIGPWSDYSLVYFLFFLPFRLRNVFWKWHFQDLTSSVGLSWKWMGGGEEWRKFAHSVGVLCRFRCGLLMWGSEGDSGGWMDFEGLRGQSIGGLHKSGALLQCCVM